MKDKYRNAIQDAFNQAFQDGIWFERDCDDALEYLRKKKVMRPKAITRHSRQIRETCRQLRHVFRAARARPDAAPRENTPDRGNSDGVSRCRRPEEKGSSLPEFDRNAEATVISLFRPNINRTFGFATYKHCEGPLNFVNCHTVRDNRLQQDAGGNVVAIWKYQRDKNYEPSSDQRARHTQYVVLYGEDAEQMGVDFLHGSNYLAGLPAPAPLADSAKSTGSSSSSVSSSAPGLVFAPQRLGDQPEIAGLVAPPLVRAQGIYPWDEYSEETHARSRSGTPVFVLVGERASLPIRQSFMPSWTSHYAPAA